MPRLTRKTYGPVRRTRRGTKVRTKRRRVRTARRRRRR